MSLPEDVGVNPTAGQQSATVGVGSAGAIAGSLTVKPPNPTMGAYSESYPGSREWTSSSGGVPLRNWSGLDLSAPKSASSPWKTRPLSQSALSKTYRYLIKPLEPKFEEGLNLNHLRKDVNKHLVTYGLDTIAYLPDPTSTTKVANVVIDYPLYVGNLVNSLKVAKDTSKLYDAMDQFNSGAAIEFLTGSLEDKLRRRLDLHVEPGDSFATTWLRLMKLITSMGPRHYDILREKVRTCSPVKYAQENITLMAEDIGVSIGELESANQYEPALTQSMLTSINNTCSAKGLFQFELMSVLKKVSAEVLICNHMSKFDANEHMESKGLDADTVLKLLQQVYNTMRLEHVWDPASRKVDRAKPQLSVVEHVSSAPKIDGLQSFIALLENSGRIRAEKVAGSLRDMSTVTCYNCNKKGHYANNCPEKKRSGRDRSRVTSGRGHKRTETEPGTSRHAWRKIAPSAGEKQSKVVDRKEYHWCAKCSKWMTSHGTATHRGSQRPKNATAVANLAANVNFGLDPSAWLVTEPDVFDTPHDDSYLSGGSVGSGLLACFYLVFVWYFLPTYGASRTTCFLGLLHSAGNLLHSVGTFTIARFDATLNHIGSRTIVLLDAVTNNIKSNMFETIPSSVLLAPMLWLFLLFLLAYAPAWAWKTPPRPARTRCRAGRVSDLGINRWSRAFRNCTPPRLRGRGNRPKATATHRPRALPGPPKKSSLRDRLRTRHKQTLRRPRPKIFKHPSVPPNRHCAPAQCHAHARRSAYHRPHKASRHEPRRGHARPKHYPLRDPVQLWNRTHPFRNPLLPRKPVLIRRDANAPAVTKRRARELDELIYGSQVPANRPKYRRIRVHRDTIFVPVSTVGLPQYDAKSAQEVLHTMFGSYKVPVTVPAFAPTVMMVMTEDQAEYSPPTPNYSTASHYCSDSESDLEFLPPTVTIKQESDDDGPVQKVTLRPRIWNPPTSDDSVTSDWDVDLFRGYKYTISDLENSTSEEDDDSEMGYAGDTDSGEPEIGAAWAMEHHRDLHDDDVTQMCYAFSEEENISMSIDTYHGPDPHREWIRGNDQVYHEEPWNRQDPSARPPMIAMTARTHPEEDSVPRVKFPTPPFRYPKKIRREEAEHFFPIVWDSGASVCVTNNRNDFKVGTFRTDASISEISGYAHGTTAKVEGEGTVEWNVLDIHGRNRRLTLKAIYMPNAKVRLISIQTYLDKYGGTIQFDKEGANIHGAVKFGKGTLWAPKNCPSNLPMSMGHSHNHNSINSISVYPGSSSLAPVPAVARENINLTGAEKELLGWHERFGHIAFAKVQHLMKAGVLATSDAGRRLQRSASQLHPLKCAACIFAKQRQRSSPGQVVKVNQAREGVLRKGNLLPGQEISVDYFQCSQKGRLFTSRGKSADKDMYSGGCMFVDHASGYIHVECQSTTSTHATITAKTSFEDMCRDHGVVPLKYLSDNGSNFTSKEFTAHLSEFKQISRFAGVGAHHHNGHAERAIQTIMSIARAMIIHAAIRWPDMADTSLWPMAVQHAVWIWNHTPNLTTGLSPSDIFTKQTYPHVKFQDLHVWGCPVYALEKRLHDGGKIPKWTPRSKRCVYLGGAPSYATSVPLVLNPDTGHISPQFHVVFDDWFHTVSADMSKFPDLHSPEWNKLFGDSSLQYMPDAEDIELMNSLDSQLEGAKDAQHVDKLRTKVMEAAENARPTVPLGPPALDTPAWRERKHDITLTSDRPVRAAPLSTIPGPLVKPSLGKPQIPSVTEAPNPVTPSVKPSVAPTGVESPAHITDDLSHPVPMLGLPPRASEFSHPVPMLVPSKPAKVVSAPVATPTPKPTNRPPTRRSRRVAGQDPIRRSARLNNTSPEFTPSINSVTPVLPPFQHFAQTLLAFIAPTGVPVGDGSQFDINGRNLSEASVSPGIFIAQKNKDPDILTYEEAMRDPDREKWLDAAGVEISELESYTSWLEVPRSEAEDKNENIVPTTWVFRRKRKPDGTIKRWKARFCVRGDLMRGITDTFAPVVAFSTVRIFLIFSLLLGWFTCSIDFSNAFIQAHRTKPIYMHLPRGFKTKKPGYILKLIRSLYGAKDAPKLWTKHLFKALRELKFTQSSLDPCLWYKYDIFIVIFVDDCGICSKTEAIADEFIKAVSDKGFKLTKEDSFAEFLGIQYEHHDNGDVHLTQKGLIKKILEATGLTEANINKVPASKETLGIDPTGEPIAEPWSYPSVIGMLLYLTTNTRPDIAFAVSQVARFTHSPKQSHAIAVKMIIRYLKGTMDYGTIVKKSDKLSLTCFCDADFAGLFQRDPNPEPSSAKSRTGYIIKLSGCPLIWKSQLQPTISLSTAESEYYSLSQAMRVLLPIRALIEEVMSNVDIPPQLRTLGNHIRATVHEDNTSCLSLATDQRITSRTRHYHVRWHFFWHHVNKGDVEVVYVETSQQDADYLTKSLPSEPFLANRRRVQGW